MIGYAYGRLEERDWNALPDVHGALHDILVDESARRHGVARVRLDAMVARLTAKRTPRVVLHTAWPNESAQKLFRAGGVSSDDDRDDARGGSDGREVAGQVASRSARHCAAARLAAGCASPAVAT